MKLLAFLFLIGYASASFYDALDDAADEVVKDFMSGMENAPPLRLVLGVDSDDLDNFEDDIKTEIGKKLKETLDHLLDKVKDSIEKGKKVKEETLKTIKDAVDKLKELHIEVKGNFVEKWEKLKDKLKDTAKDVFERLKQIFGISKRSTDEAEVALAELNLKNIMEKLKEMIKEKFDVELIKEKLVKMFKGSELLDQLLQYLKEQGKKKLLELIDHLLGNRDERSTRSVKEIWDNIKDYFKDLHIDLKEKFFKFGEWIKDVLGSGIEKSKDKIANIRNLAKEFVERAKNVSKDVAVEALEFFRPYKEDLKELYDQMKDRVKEIIQRD